MCVREFVNQDSAEFAWFEQSIDANGKQNAWRKNSTNCGAGMFITVADGNAVHEKV